MKNHSRLRTCCAVIIAALLLVGCGSLSRSAIKGNLSGVEKYIQKGEDVNKYDRWGWTPLLWAVYYNYYEVVNCLLENGADPNIRTKKAYRSIAIGSTPLLVASYYDYSGIVRTLLRHRADKSIKNGDNQTPLLIAEKYNFGEIINILEMGPSYRSPDSTADDGPAAEMNQVIILNDGSRIVGKILSQTRTTVTVKTKYTTMIIDKTKITEMKYK
ncbi:MAG: ankyrin repeat domain-containing protein [Spirochaetes bacterium]|nr:ankyrin repeat domain-containing protein [Spirochaetota bacterium]